GRLIKQSCWEQVPSQRCSKNQGILACMLSEAPLGPAYIFSSFSSSDLAKAEGRKEEKTAAKNGSSHCTAAGKEDVELPNLLNSCK
ncbi:unnamed protein product, partial [Prunus brigantina]